MGCLDLVLVIKCWRDVKMVNVAVLGCGMVGKIIPPVMRQAGADITAVFGVDKAEAEGLVSTLHLGEGVFTGSVAEDYERVVKGNEVPVDFVYIGTPNFLHAGPAIAAANARKHVFSEKPLAPTIDDVLAMQKAIRGNGVLFEVDSAYGDHELPVQIQEEIAAGELGRVLFAEVIYDQDWQKAVDGEIGWRPVIEIAGKGKLIPDLGFHGIYTLMKLTGGVVESIDGRATNVHPTRYKLKETSGPDTFGSSGAPSYTEKPELYDVMQMLGPLPPGVTEESIVPGYDPRIFTGDLSGDDIAQAHMMVAKDGYSFPVYMRLSQVLKGKNEFTIKIVCENGSYEWKQPDPNHMEKEIGDQQLIVHRGSDPGIYTLPPDHPAGYTTAVGLKVEPFLAMIEKAKAGTLTSDDVGANRAILTRAVQTQFVLDQWMLLQQGQQKVQYRD
jgi:predicted dehydrogenase